MKQRNWIWFVASGLLAIIAGVAAVVALQLLAARGGGTPAVVKPRVVVARTPIGAETIIRADMVRVEEVDPASLEGEALPNGAVTEVGYVVGRPAVRDIAEGEILTTALVPPPESPDPDDWELEEEYLAVALPANDILSQWGAVNVGDHVDVLLSLDVILETPMYPQEEAQALPEGESLQILTRDQSMDKVSALVLQNLEVLRIIQEPQTAQEEEAAAPRQRAMILKITPQDAVLLKYFRNSGANMDLALRASENATLYDVEAVNINYLILRYGINMPEPLR
jgi:Flp pilus assembly protein CpaB